MCELTSLIDPSNANPTLPTGHPFTNVQSAHYCSLTSWGESLSWGNEWPEGVTK